MHRRCSSDNGSRRLHVLSGSSECGNTCCTCRRIVRGAEVSSAKQRGWESEPRRFVTSTTETHSSVLLLRVEIEIAVLAKLMG